MKYSVHKKPDTSNGSIIFMNGTLVVLVLGVCLKKSEDNHRNGLFWT